MTDELNKLREELFKINRKLELEKHILLPTEYQCLIDKKQEIKKLLIHQKLNEKLGKEIDKEEKNK